MPEQKITESVGILLDEEIKLGQTFTLEVLTWSMSPFLKPCDKIIVRKEPPQTISCGDIVVFRRQADICSHRLLYKKRCAGETQFVTKGDNVYVKDEPVTEKDLLGKAVCIKRGLRTINLEGAWQKLMNRHLGMFFRLEAELFLYLRNLKRLLWKPQSKQQR